jgi:hypothetical protein
VAKGKWQVPGGRLAASTPIALAFGINSAIFPSQIGPANSADEALFLAALARGAVRRRLYFPVGFWAQEQDFTVFGIILLGGLAGRLKYHSSAI